jgi:hypothetical protein
MGTDSDSIYNYLIRMHLIFVQILYTTLLGEHYYKMQEFHYEYT